MSKPAAYFFDRTLDGSERVDNEAGVISGVSVITSGVQARGHNLEVDKKTLDQINECALSMKQVPVKINHKSGAESVIGYLDNFRLDSGKLKADWNLLKSHERYAHVMEMASRMPRNVGLSAAFMGKEETKGLKKFARCTELIAVDLVANPAANPDGLFESKVDAPENGMSATAADNKTELSTEDKILASLQSFESRFAALEDFQKQLIEFASEDDNEDEVEDDEGEADEVGDEADESEEFSSPLEAALVYLQRKVESQAQAEQDASLEHAFNTVNEKVASLIELNEQLVAKNEALELAAKQGHGTAVTSGQESKVRLFSQDGNLDPFEARVTELEAGGKKKTEAIQLAIKEDRARYEQHMVRIGALAK